MGSIERMRSHKQQKCDRLKERMRSLKPKNAIGRRPRYAIAYKYSIPPTMSSGVYTS
ncbi:MAG: hypothetical protein F6K56_19755 [Moorea sp. SIO3G5]|nr:hypothetical protein [Moorena sp. SIO3G5]